MADIALTEANVATDLATRAETTRRAGRGDARFHFLTWAAAAARAADLLRRDRLAGDRLDPRLQGVRLRFLTNQ